MAESRSVSTRSMIYQAAVNWKILCGYELRITYGYKCKPHSITIGFEPEQFYHLAGFQYMSDVANIPHHSTRTVLDSVLNGKITQEMVESAERYAERVLPRLYAICSMDTSLENDFKLYSFKPQYYSFHTFLKGDYLISFQEKDISFVFLVKDSVVNDDIYNCLSAFVKGECDYAQNQRSFVILKKELHDKATDTWSTIYKSPKLDGQ